MKISVQQILWVLGLVVGAFWVFPLSAAKNLGDPFFYQLQTHNGLSQMTIRCMTQDKQGFMWFGTQDGLNKYNGNSFKVFRRYEKDSLSPAGNFIQAISVDSSGYVWVGSDEGLHCFDPVTETWQYPARLFRLPPSYSGLLRSNVRVFALYTDTRGTIWVGTERGFMIICRKSATEPLSVEEFTPAQLQKSGYSGTMIQSFAEGKSGVMWIGGNQGLLQYHNTTSSLRPVQTEDRAHPVQIPSIQSLKVDFRGNLWIGTVDGLFQYFPSHNHIKGVQAAAGNLSNTDIRAICEDYRHTIWIGTFGGGLVSIDSNYLQSKVWIHSSTNPLSLSDNQVVSLYEDRGNVLWVGTWSGGINYTHASLQRFNLISNDPLSPFGLSVQQVRAIAQWGDKLWVGTIDGMIHIVDAYTKKVAHKFRLQNKNDKKFDSGEIRTLTFLRDGTLWVGTNFGLFRIQPNTGIIEESFVQDKAHPVYKSSLTHSAIRCVLEDRKGILWIGTLKGMNVIDRKKKTIRTFMHEPGKAGIPGDQIWSVIESRDGTIWVGSLRGGLGAYNRETGAWKIYRHILSDSSSIISDRVSCVYEDTKGRTWVATQGGGLDEFIPQQGTFRHFTTKDGLGNDALGGILEDFKGTLWISTIGGVSRFFPEVRQAENYTAGNGLFNHNFYIGSYYKTSGGEICFGGNTGLTVIVPENIITNRYAPPVLLTGLRKFHQSVVLDSALYSKHHITIPYSDSFITIEFSALSYAAPYNNRYMYKMEGFDKEWIEAGRGNEASYTNLDPGTYHFMVKACNNDGVWNPEPARLTIIIVPPWWATFWFRTLVILALMASLLFAHKTRTRVLKRRSSDLESIVHERTVALEEANNEIQRQLSVLEDQAQEIEMTNAGLQEVNIELQSAYNNISLLSRIGYKITSMLDTESIFLTLYEGIATLMNVDVFAIGTYEKEEQELHLTLGIENGERLPTMIYSMRETNRMAVVCAQTRQEIFITDMEQEYERFAVGAERPAPKAGKYVNSLVYIPLVAEERLFGVLTVQSYQKHVYAEHQMNMLRSLIPYVTAALTNATAYGEIQRQMDILDQQAMEIELTNTELQQKNLLLEQLNKEKNEFLGIVAHDLKNPLSGIMMAAAVVEKYWTQLTLKEITERLQSIQRSSDRMNSIIGQLLDINAIETGKFHLSLTEFNLIGIMHSIVHEYRDRAASKDILLHFSDAPDLVMVFADQNACIEIFENLVSNAVKYSPRGKNIYLSIYASLRALPSLEEYSFVQEGVELTQKEAEKQREFHSASPYSHLPFPSVRFVIRDEGPGFTEEDKRKLFGKFSRLSARPTAGEDSTGLGLSIVKKLVEVMNGVVWCESTEGNGATFIVELPSGR